MGEGCLYILYRPSAPPVYVRFSPPVSLPFFTYRRTNARGKITISFTSCKMVPIFRKKYLRIYERGEGDEVGYRGS